MKRITGRRTDYKRPGVCRAIKSRFLRVCGNISLRFLLWPKSCLYSRFVFWKILLFFFCFCSCFFFVFRKRVPSLTLRRLCFQISEMITAHASRKFQNNILTKADCNNVIKYWMWRRKFTSPLLKKKCDRWIDNSKRQIFGPDMRTQLYAK